MSDFYKQHQDEIKEILEDLIDSKKPHKVVSAGSFEKTLNAELKHYGFFKYDRRLYTLIHVACIYLNEEGKYSHLFLLYNKTSGDVLEFVMFTEGENLSDIELTEHIDKLSKSSQKKLTKFFASYNKCNSYADEFTPGMKRAEQELGVYKARLIKPYTKLLNNFFSILNKKEMLLILGYFLYVYSFQRDMGTKKYNPILNIECPANLNNSEIYSLLSCMNTILTGETSIPGSRLIQSHELSDNKALRDKLEKIKSDIIIADASNQYAMRKLGEMTDLYYSYKKTLAKKGDGDLILGLIIITKNSFLDKQVINATCKQLEIHRVIETKRKHAYLRDLTAHFCQHIKEQEERNTNLTFENACDFTSENISSLTNEIYEASIYDTSKSQTLAPIILTLNHFFEFLNNENYISADTCNFYLQIVRSIYIPESATMNDAVISDDLPENIVVKCLYSLINKSKSLISTSIDKTPFIYTQSTKYGNMICFNNIEDVIMYIKNNIEHLDEKLYSKFYDIVLMENSSSGAQLLKRRLKEKNLIITNAGRPDYRIKNKTYLALDIDKIALLIQDVKM